MEKHGNVTIDFVNYGFKKVDVRIPFHMTAKDLINELCELYGLESKQRELEYQSFKAVISEQFVSGKQTLLDANIKDGEILIVIR